MNGVRPNIQHREANAVIVVTGANGYIGAALIRHMHSALGTRSRSLRAVVRSSRGAGRLRDLPAQMVRVDYRDPFSLSAAFEGATAVVHLAGALRPSRAESLYDANVETTRAVVDAVRTASVRTLVYVSAPGALPGSPNDYLGSKGLAEVLVREAGVGGSILRVPMVLGRGSASFATLCRMASSRFVPLISGGSVRVQPVALDDVVAAICWALDRSAEPLITLDLVGPDTLLYADLLEKVADRLGKKPRVLPIPGGLAAASAHIAAWFPAVGWNWSLFDTLFHEHLADPSPARAVLPFELTPMDRLFDQLFDGG